ncbi:hypothetical protein J2Y69_001831 [Microbacterium resistens]|uniref:DUF2029 domain-containing protein n=1 Tax=Microbacterium resistens TaxID=156977 RepID=A0ABU1SC95_9MICO|nr:hypothetical protein [Microbacterium resistens]MDR6867230.1 hypothetical protein [Microbacterium resistens]
MSSRLAAILFWGATGALLIANLIVAWHSLTAIRFWEDEAFNLTVPRNLLAGLGYASDGALSGSSITLFDARISTGPVVLLPVAALLAAGIDPVTAARLVPLAYWALLLVGLWVLGRRVAGRWGALVAAALPLAFNAAQSISPIQGPADLLGEIPAAALIVWALVVLPRRAWLAGLLVGLAIQAKLIALLALPAFAVALIILAPGDRFLPRLGNALRRAILPLVLVAAPTAAMEAVTFFSLGPAGFREHLKSVRDFVLSGGQHVEPTTIPQKLQTLAESWFVPSWAIVAALLLLVAAGVVAARSSRLWRDPSLLALTAASAIGLLTFVGWWAQAAHTPLWVRHPSIGVLAFTPVLAALGVRAVQALWRRTPESLRTSVPLRVAAVVAGLAVAAPIAVGGLAHTAGAIVPTGAETLDGQRAQAAALLAGMGDRDRTWIAASPWGAAVPIVVLMGSHVGLDDATTMQSVVRLTTLPCPGGASITDAGSYRICPAP